MDKFHIWMSSLRNWLSILIQITFICKIWKKNVTFKCFSFMNGYEYVFQVCYGCKFWWTNFTFECLPFINWFNMLFQITFICKIWRTNVTFECFSLRMDLILFPNFPLLQILMHNFIFECLPIMNWFNMLIQVTFIYEIWRTNVTF